MVMKKRFTNLGSLIKRSNTTAEVEPAPDADTPEANAARGVRLFCESGAANSGEEVLHLPTIVEAAVASPSAAAAAAAQIRKFLSKENYSRPHVQYNAIMIIRILADNPGQSFTKNLDKHFSDTVKHLLRNGQDPSVAQILRETLDALEREKAYDTNLNTLFAMWRKEKTLMANAAKQFGPRTMNAPPWQGDAQLPGGFSQGGGRSGGRGLPAPVELVGRIEEARTSAKLLLQLVQSTPPNELLGNDLVKEFSERCMAAQRSIQGYINCDNPPPDDDTMLTLIETNEQLSLAASKHQRAVLQARRLQGPSPSPPVLTANTTNPTPPIPPPSNTYTPIVAPVPQLPPQTLRSEVPLLPPLDVGSKDKGDLPLPPSLQAGPTRRRTEAEDENPFADHHSPTYVAPSGPPPPPPRRASDADNSPPSNLGPHTGSPNSYNPGYPSTPSYPGQQQSSSNNLTMHGAGQGTLTEEEEYARDYPVSNGPRTPEQARRPQRDSDVSPIAERGTVTYRY
ncbi:uncharacterized protein BDR25DRAFT_325996 [Lindgomyces ingoldianus]|uniref:Uncharacterized protein n=1 Tax=Lindgomyces ingoldianus TaxID=673940 RepID=A0ACB6QSP2_9PLEO|nr:uncharacterized protein BDR25DRAFT_325996 [Lindgomyces ingoldianus]KAF2469862.1 hypothetical protein BDR25DRAFT_325996 [Lindgomyces ingoldianus]